MVGHPMVSKSTAEYAMVVWAMVSYPVINKCTTAGYPTS